MCIKLFPNFPSKKSSARSISLALTTYINKRCDLTNVFGAVTLQMILSRSTHIMSGFENCSFSLQFIYRYHKMNKREQSEGHPYPPPQNPMTLKFDFEFA